MNKTLLVGFLIAIATQSLGQGIVVQNSNPTSSIANKGSYIADSIFRIGTRDTVKPSWWNPAWSFNGALQIGLDGKPYYYYGGYWRGVGSGASVTSITQGYGMTLSPNPIVSTGSVRVDTTEISTKANVNNLLSAKLNISDTSFMLGGYLRKADTASLSNRINLKLNIADTNSMLGGYLRKVDTLTLSNRIDARVKYTDTAAMLAPYATDAQVALKLNIVDTANMRIRPIAGSNMTISGTYPNVTFASTTIPTDSTIFATNYRVDTAKSNLRTSINTKLNSADTASLSARIDLRVKYSDTSAMLGGYLKKVDTSSLSTRIDARVKYIDTAAMLSPYLPSAAAAATYVPYTGATTNVNLGTHTISSYNSVVNHTSGSGVAASITKGGSGEALTVVKSSGSGNAASITGGVTLLSELHLNTDLADAYIASAANWNAKIGAGDTAAMLSSYLRKADTASLSTRINTKLNSADTASLSNRINLKLNSADTASLSTRIDARVKYSDTSAMLGGYLRKVDTASLSNRIDAAGNDWKLTGNAGTNASTNYVGTSDNVDVVLRRNNVEKLRIANASISTADPLRIGTNSYNAPASFALAANNWVFGSDLVAMGQNQYRSTAGISWAYISGGGQVGNFSISNTGLSTHNGNGGYLWYESGVERLRMISADGVVFNINGSNTNFRIRGTTNTNLFHLNANTNNIGIGTNAPNASSILDLTSTTQGLGLPSMTTTQQNAIATPRTGLEIYNSTLLTPQFYNGSVWTGGWNKRGNAGTDAANDFIGTTDGVDVMFRRGNVRAGFLNSSLNNTSFGVTSMPTNVTGAQNAAYGSNSLPVLTSGSSNSSYGYFSLYNNTTGANNSAFGNNSLASNVSSNSNSAFGFQALNSVTGAQNTGVGHRAGLSSTIGNNNVSVGFDATAATTGGDNTALGSYASAATTGSQNIAVGRSSNSGTTGSKNLVLAYSGSLPTATSSNQMNIGNVLWGADCSGTGTTAAGSLSVGVNTPNASAIFDIVSTTKGLGLPSMTTTQQNAIGTPRAGLAVYNSTLGFPTYYNGTTWGSFASGWGLTGNAGTSDATNFIGTTDGVDVIFKRNNVVSGRLNDARQTTSFGVGTLPTTSTGDGNTAFGWKALNVSTSGGANTALGFWSLRLCTTGFSNSAVGQLSLGSLTTGFSNCAFGEGSGQGITSGTSNTFYGNGSGNAMTTGANNIGVGVNAMSTSTAGSKNLVISASGAVPSTTGSDQLNVGNVLWGVNCSGTGTTAAGRLGIGTNAPNASALLDLTSTTQGLLLPRMTTAQINAIGSPAAGLTVYNTDLLLICFYNGTAWQKVTATTM
jgi:hypothetical protein